MKVKLLQLARENASASQPIRIEAKDDEATIYLYGVIGAWWGDIDEKAFATQLAATSASTIHLRIDSPGGDVFAARAMMTAISQHKANVVAHVDGYALSAATGICMACDSVEMTQGAKFMIHNAWTVAMGNKADLTEVASLLAGTDAALVNDYARRTGKPADQIAAWMDAETWFTADEAKEHGFVDAVVEVVKKRPANTWNLSAYQNAPALSEEPKVDDAAVVALRDTLERRFALLERIPA